MGEKSSNTVNTNTGSGVISYPQKTFRPIEFTLKVC